MKRDDQKQNRLNNLALLKTKYKFEYIGKKCDVNASYLSQIHNQVIQKGGKTPRSLSDEYAVKIEKGLNLGDGWMDENHSIAENPGVYTSNVSPGPDIQSGQPLISWVQAGNWADVIDNFTPGDAEDWLPCPVKCSKSTFVLQVEGESMMPDYRHNDLIFVDPEVHPENGKDIVVRTNNGKNKATFKRLIIDHDGKKWLKPINEHWPEQVIEFTDGDTLCGTVVFSGKYR